MRLAGRLDRLLRAAESESVWKPISELALSLFAINPAGRPVSRSVILDTQWTIPMCQSRRRKSVSGRFCEWRTVLRACER